MNHRVDKVYLTCGLVTLLCGVLLTAVGWGTVLMSYGLTAIFTSLAILFIVFTDPC